jgi:hypothetical protein
MYKRFKITKKYEITFNKFPKTAKEVSKVYHTGIRNWVADDSYNYSIVLGTFRIIFAINREMYNTCGSH